MTMPPMPVPTKFQNLLREIKFFGADAYTETQLTEYAAAVRAATLEEAAKVCDLEYESGLDDANVEWWRCAEYCATAIRALKEGS